MVYHVLISARAEMEIEQAHEWWAVNRSRVEADRWYREFKKAILSLSDDPYRHALSIENASYSVEIRDLLFGLGSRPSHRAVFTIKGNQVQVLTVRHAARSELRQSDLP